MRVNQRMIPALLMIAFCVVIGLSARADDDNEGKRAASNVLYIANNDPATGQNAILAYRRDPTNGCLSPLGVYPTGGTGFANPLGFLGPNDGDRDMIVSPNHRLLFSVNAGSNNISVFKINSDGSLTPVKGSPFPSGGSFPSGLALVDDLLIVSNMNAALTLAGLPGDPTTGHANYTSFRVSESGKLRPIKNSSIAVTNPPANGAGNVPIPLPPFLATSPAPTSIVATPNGKFLFGTELFGNRIDVMSIGEEGTLTQTASLIPPISNPPPAEWLGFVLPSVVPGAVMPNLNLPLNANVHPTQPILYVNFVAYTQIGIYTWNEHGVLSYVRSVVNAGPGLPVPGFAPCWNIVSPNGKYMYVMNGLTNSIVSYSLADPLTPLSIQHLPLNPGGGGIRIVQDPEGKFVYGLSHPMSPGTISLIHVLKVNDDGTLTEQADCSPVNPPLPPMALPQGIVVL